MAGFADPDTALALQQSAFNTAREPSTRRSLPSGPCNYRDAFGNASCGCDQFWDKSHAELHDGSKALQSNEQSTWCVCEHHACFHLRVSRAPPNQHEHTNFIQAQAYGSFAGGPAVGDGRLKASHSAIDQRMLLHDAPRASGPGRAEHTRDALSQASTSGLPSVPSVCRLSYDQRPAADSGPRYDASRQTVAGLGLSMMQLGSVGALNRQQSPSPTIADDSLGRAPPQSFNEPDLPSTRANSIATEPNRRASPSLGMLDHVLEFNRNLQVNVPGDTLPNTYNPDDYIKSATEVATPSAANTPDLGLADQAVEDGKNLIDTLARLTSATHQPHGSPSIAGSATSPYEVNLPAVRQEQEQLQQILQAAPPQALQKLMSYLAPLHNLLNSIPNVANTMRDHTSRLEMLENSSFQYVQPEDMHQTLSMYDDRIVHLEYRMDEHDKHHQAVDADQGSSSYGRRRIHDVNASFGSNNSLQSTTSSALILAAMDRKDTEMEIGDIKDRLDMLEAAALPTTFQPWEIEVVLVPWGRDLRGIWFSHDESMHDTTKTTTQDSEEWTQARRSRLGQTTEPFPAQRTMRETDSSPYHGAHDAARVTIFGDTESGWSSQAISEWASGSPDDWLFAKACGSNNLVHKRLQSRGFIRNVTLKSASARDVQATLSSAFNELLEHLSYVSSDGDDVVAAHPGLRASFIPLRKVHKSSKLRFLTPAEMSSSALWSAQFLASGVMMRVSGGKKRLYVTQRESYVQRVDDLGSTWTWQELRQLPRYQPDQDSQMEGNDEQCQPVVPEADAKEPCWQYIEAYDAPPASVHSSFGSNRSVELSMRPADRSWRRSITPSSIMKTRMAQPISPLSEFHPRPGQPRLRTASASVLDQIPTGSSKRRFNASPVKQSSAPQTALRTPSVSVARLKRRRTTHGPPTHQEQQLPAASRINVCNPTPRRSREPPSPFYSSNPVLPRSNSDVASRPSQRSAVVVGKSTPFAYATPHSGPFAGGPRSDNFNHGGDTEPDDDNDVYEEDDGEQSWHGVTDGDDDAGSTSGSSGPDPEHGAQYGASFSGDDSGFGTESGDDDGEQSEFDVDRNPRHHTTTDDDEEEDGDVLDTLLDVLQH